MAGTLAPRAKIDAPERCCIVLQTLRSGVPVDVAFREEAIEAPAGLPR